MDGGVVQIAATALVLVSLGNLYHIFFRRERIQVWVNKRKATRPKVSQRPRRCHARVINVEAQEIPHRPMPPKLEGPQKWTFDDIYGAR